MPGIGKRKRLVQCIAVGAIVMLCLACQTSADTVGTLDFQINIEEIEVDRLAGDANLDGVVCADDYVSIQANFGNTGINLIGDANNDGLVGADDYASVQANFGACIVPLPASVWMALPLLGGIAVVVAVRRKAI